VLPASVVDSVVDLLRDLFAKRQRGDLSDAEARWVLAIVLPVYGLTVADLATALTSARSP
jgi:hypothetical protein